MYISDREITLRDGRNCLLKTARPKDAAGLIVCLKTVFGETDFLLRGADEFLCTEEEEKEFLRQRLGDPYSFFMIADVEGEIAAICSVVPRSCFQRLCHRCEFAVSIRKEYWSVGIGSNMLAYALELAGQMGFEQVELGVVDGNDRARALYERFGFEVFGKIPRAMKYRDGACRDEWMMVKILENTGSERDGDA